MKIFKSEAVGARIRFRDELQEETGRRLLVLADSFKMLAGDFGGLAQKKQGLDKEDYDIVVENLYNYLCSECACCQICWDERYEESSRLIYSLTTQADVQGELDEQETRAALDGHCANPKGYIRELERSLDFVGSKRLWKNLLSESRESAAVQLSEVSRILSEFSGEVKRPGEVMELRRWIISARLRQLGIRAKKIYLFRRPKKGLELQIVARCKKGSMAVTNVAKELGSVIECRLVARADSKRVIGSEYAMFRFCEDVNYKTLNGVARVAAREISGDSFSFLQPESGDMLMMLSDGMGSGAAAGRESSFAIEFLEKLLETGFREENAVRLLNSALVMHSEQTVFSTIDIAMINLYTGMCSFIKLGAAITMIKRGKSVEMIYSGELPVGIMNDIECQCIHKKVFDGDYIIMLSDGAFESVAPQGREAYFADMIASLSSKNPQEMADDIIKNVRAAAQGEVRDDMTVLVCGIWKKI